MTYRDSSGLSIDELQKRIADLEKDNTHLKSKIRGDRKRKIKSWAIYVMAAVAVVSIVYGISTTIARHHAAEKAWTQKKLKEVEVAAQAEIEAETKMRARIVENNKNLVDSTYEAVEDWVNKYNLGHGDSLCYTRYLENSNRLEDGREAVSCVVMDEEKGPIVGLNCYPNTKKCYRSGE